MTRLTDLISRFRRDERGVFLVVFAVMAVVLIATSGAVVDFTRVQQARTRAQTGLDAAALALAHRVGESNGDAASLKAAAQSLLTERVADSSIEVSVYEAIPDDDNDKLTLKAYIVVPTSFVQLVGLSSIRASMLSEVTSSSSNLEVAVAADITYSMLGTRLSGLKDALKTTINLLVKTDQKPTYSRMAIAPYSNGVNVGKYADEVRPVTKGKTITSVTGVIGSVKTMTSISKADPAEVTSNSHGFAAGDYIYVSGVAGGGFTAITEGIYKVAASPSTNKFKLLKANGTNVKSSSYSGSYTGSSGKMIKCANSTCKVVITTSSNHNFADTDIVLIKGAGASYFNDKFIEVSEKTNTTFVPKGVSPLTANIMGTGGTAYCTKYGCEYYRFVSNDNNKLTTFTPSKCAVERTTSANLYLDTDPKVAPVGIQYEPSNGRYYNSFFLNLEACPTSEIQPLTDSRSDLTTLVDGFVAQGSTAGHIGLAWAWYMLSPDFTKNISGWPTPKPADYLEEDTIKAIILMTDGEFNTMYDYGVPSKDADYVDAKNQTKNNATNSSLVQAGELCTEIKKAKYGIFLYVIGFGITKDSVFDKELKKCATNESMYKTASDSASLKKAFEAIAEDLSNLRVSK